MCLVQFINAIFLLFWEIITLQFYSIRNLTLYLYFFFYYCTSFYYCIFFHILSFRLQYFCHFRRSYKSILLLLFLYLHLMIRFFLIVLLIRCWTYLSPCPQLFHQFLIVLAWYWHHWKLLMVDVRLFMKVGLRSWLVNEL